MIDYAAVLIHRYPDALWSLNGDDYAGLTWHSDGPKPSQEELDAAWPEVLLAIQSQADAVETARQSALAKLQALGLTEAEALALVGGI